MPEVTNIDRQLEVRRISHTSLINDPVNSIIVQTAQAPLTVIPTHFEGPSVLKEHVHRTDIDADDTRVDIDMGEHRDSLEVATERESS